MSGKVAITAPEKHFGDVTSLVHHNGHIFSAGSDAKLKIFDENLNQIKEIPLHEAHIYALAMDKQSGTLYSSSCDSYIKMLKNPLKSDQATNLMKNPDVEMDTMFVDDQGVLYVGDDHGGVTAFDKEKPKFKMGMLEPVHGLMVENNWIYTINVLDLMIQEFNKDNGNCMVKGHIPGKNPMCFVGKKENGKKQFIAVPTRDGKGIQMIKNNHAEKFQTLCSKENLHEFIINAVGGTENYIFTCCYGGAIKRFTPDLSLAGEVSTGICANTLTVVDDNTVYVGFTDGSIRKIVF